MASKHSRMIRRLIRPRSWSVTARRIVAVTFPVSIPLWILSVAMLGSVALAASVREPIVSFWNAPPKRRVGGYYNYGASKRTKS